MCHVAKGPWLVRSGFSQYRQDSKGHLAGTTLVPEGHGSSTDGGVVGPSHTGPFDRVHEAQSKVTSKSPRGQSSRSDLVGILVCQVIEYRSRPCLLDLLQIRSGRQRGARPVSSASHRMRQRSSASVRRRARCRTRRIRWGSIRRRRREGHESSKTRETAESSSSIDRTILRTRYRAKLRTVLFGQRRTPDHVAPSISALR